MVQTIIINSQNYVHNSGNQYRYNFPSEVTFSKGAQVGLQSISLYNSTFNISSQFKNNEFTIIWNANTTTTINAVIPDGFYSPSDLNFLLQNVFITNNMYMLNADNNYVFFAELLPNAVRYAIQLNTFALPTAAQATTLGFTLPEGATWSLPTVSKSSQIKLNPGLGILLGFTEVKYPTMTFPVSSTSSVSNVYLSNISPQVSTVNTYLITLNIINNSYASPNNVFHALALTESFGQLITVSSSNILFTDISEGRYGYILVNILDQYYNNVILNDTEFTLMLAIKE